MILLFPCATYAQMPAQMLAPDILARSVTDEVLAIVRADKDIKAGNHQKVIDLVEAKVLPHFSFPRMTQLAMGKNWRLASPDQRKRLTSEFRALMVRTYTTAFTQYKNYAIAYKPVRMGPADTEVVVRSAINRSSGQPVAVDYNMEKTATGWKVYNLKIESVSLIENYRNTFNNEVQKHGVDGLINTLAERNKTVMQVTQK